jgi:hypothetical protein
VESKLDKTEERDPEIKVNTTTPITIITMQNNLSVVVAADMSPYPTVVMVVTVK